MRKFIRWTIAGTWFLVSIGVAIWLSDEPWLSDDPFLRRLEVHLLMVGTVAFIYGLFSGFFSEIESISSDKGTPPV